MNHVGSFLLVECPTRVKATPSSLDSAPEGDGFEPSVPVDKPWVLSGKNPETFADPRRQALPQFDATGMLGSALFVKWERGLALLSPCRPSLSLASSSRPTLFLVYPA